MLRRKTYKLFFHCSKTKFLLWQNWINLFNLSIMINVVIFLHLLKYLAALNRFTCMWNWWWKAINPSGHIYVDSTSVSLLSELRAERMSVNYIVIAKQKRGPHRAPREQEIRADNQPWRYWIVPLCPLSLLIPPPLPAFMASFQRTNCWRNEWGAR